MKGLAQTQNIDFLNIWNWTTPFAHLTTPSTKSILATEPHFYFLSLFLFRQKTDFCKNQISNLLKYTIRFVRPYQCQTLSVYVFTHLRHIAAKVRWVFPPHSTNAAKSQYQNVRVGDSVQTQLLERACPLPFMHPWTGLLPHHLCRQPPPSQQQPFRQLSLRPLLEAPDQPSLLRQPNGDLFH